MTASEKKADQPNFNARRSGLDLTLGVLGSYTPIKSTSGLTPTAHVSGLSFVGIRYHFLGLYGAPEYGQGGGYRSTMLGDGLSLGGDLGLLGDEMVRAGDAVLVTPIEMASRGGGDDRGFRPVLRLSAGYRF